MRRTLLPVTILACLLVGLPAAPAMARPTPKVKLVSPMRVKVGGKLAIRGKGFSTRRKRNTVVFRAPNGRTALAKPRKASRRKLVLIVPASLEALLSKQSGRPAPTRFKLRVLSGKLGKYTKTRTSPLVVSGGVTGKADCDSDGQPNSSDSDDDNDLLSDAREVALKTASCAADTDGDGSEDGFEQESALDLNQRALPYPGKRPYPNALDPGDGGKDYDGDAMTNKEEFAAWVKTGASPAGSLLQEYYGGAGSVPFQGPYGSHPRFGGHTFPLNYSDGDQSTVPVFSGSEEYAWYLDMDRDGALTDDERDVDGDGLGNLNEIRLLMYEKHYSGLDPEECPYEYTPWLPRDFAPADYLDWDVDGDGVWDGNDDQDNDDIANVDEIQPPFRRCGDPPDDIGPFPTSPMRNPFNPCLPYRSRACSIYKPR